MKAGEAYYNCIFYPGNNSVLQKSGNEGVVNLWSSAKKWRVCNGHCDDNFYIQTSPCVICDEYKLPFCSKATFPYPEAKCLLLFYKKKRIRPPSVSIPRPNIGPRLLGNRTTVSMITKNLNEERSEECLIDHCPIPVHILKQIKTNVNKSVPCLGDEKNEKKKVAKDNFYNPVVLGVVIGTTLILTLVIIIVVCCCCSRENGEITNRTLSGKLKPAESEKGCDAEEERCRDKRERERRGEGEDEVKEVEEEVERKREEGEEI